MAVILDSDGQPILDSDGNPILDSYPAGELVAVEAGADRVHPLALCHQPHELFVQHSGRGGRQLNYLINGPRK